MRQDAQRSNLATAEITETNNLVFAGALFNRGAFAEVGAELDPLLPGGDERLKDTEGLTLRVRAEGHTYACVLRTRECDTKGSMVVAVVVVLQHICARVCHCRWRRAPCCVCVCKQRALL